MLLIAFLKLIGYRQHQVASETESEGKAMENSDKTDNTPQQEVTLQDSSDKLNSPSQNEKPRMRVEIDILVKGGRNANQGIPMYDLQFNGCHGPYY